MTLCRDCRVEPVLSDYDECAACHVRWLAAVAAWETVRAVCVENHGASCGCFADSPEALATEDASPLADAVSAYCEVA